LEEEFDEDTEDEDYEGQINEAIQSGIFEKKFDCGQKFSYVVFLGIYRLSAILYTVMYFYFAPFFVIILVYWSQIVEAGKIDAKVLTTT
jgi:hypothetical protein